MKKLNLILLAVMLFVSSALVAQTDNFNYQAAVRDANGEVLQNENVNIQFSIRQASASGTEVYAETHNVSTNDQGLVNLSIGGGTATVGTFSTINWSTNSHFINVKVDGVDMGTSELKSVPYANYAQNAGNVFSGDFNDLTNVNVDDADADATNEIQTLSLSGTTISLSNGGGSINLPTGTTDTDDQNLSLSGTSLSIDDGTGVDFTAWDTNAGDDFSGSFADLTGVPADLADGDDVDDADADATNEIQVISISNDTIFLTNGGFVVLPSSSGAEFVNNAGIVSNTTNQATSSFVFGSDDLNDIVGTTTDNARMFFDKSSGAFRAGYVYNSSWNTDSLGTSSFATGYNTKAIGNYSTAMGHSSEASGNEAFAMGYNTEASGGSSTAMGSGTKASGGSSTAMGSDTEASGNWAIAAGYNTEASGGSSTAMGTDTEASGNNSTAMGSGTKASAQNSFAIGDNTKGKGFASAATGLRTQANATSSFVVGRYNDTLVDVGVYFTDIQANDPLFIVGNGSNSANPNNALVVFHNGAVQIDSLAGSSTRQVFADANGVLTTEPTTPTVRSMPIHDESAGVNFWTHPEHNVTVSFDNSNDMITVTNNSGNNYWDISISGASTGNAFQQISSDVDQGASISLTLGNSFNGSFTIIAGDEASSTDGFVMQITYYSDNLSGMVSYW